MQAELGYDEKWCLVICWPREVRASPGTILESENFSFKFYFNKNVDERKISKMIELYVDKIIIMVTQFQERE